MPVIEDPELLKVIKEWRDKQNHIIYNKIIDTTYPSNYQFVDLSGKDFDYIHVDKYCGRSIKNIKYYYCTCNYCGLKAIMPADSIVSKYNKTCGCFKYKHSYSHDRLYHTYQNIYDRCYNPGNHSYLIYGGRGIHMDDEWLGEMGYINFRNWAYKNGYSEDYENPNHDYISLDRIDNDKNYGPTNCRFADMKLQSNNRSTTRFIWYDKYIFSGQIWAEIMDISRSTFFTKT